MAYRSVKIKNYLNIFNEFEANAAISPGMLVELMSTGKVRAHATEGGNAVPLIALEDYLQGKDISDAYAAGDQVQVWTPQRGDEGYVQLEDEQNVAIGDFLESNGAGYFQKAVNVEISSQAADVVYPKQLIAIVLEALDLSGLSAAGSSDTPARQFVRVMFV